MGDRGEKFKKKLNGKLIGKIYARLKPQMVKNHTAYQMEAVRVEEQVKSILCEVNVLELPYYMIFGKEVLKVLRKHQDQTAEQEINILLQKWCDRGLHPINLYRILTLYFSMACKIKIWDGVDEATVTPEGWLDVKTHTPDKCFGGDYADVQTNIVIITPTAGKRIEIISVYVSTEDGLGHATLNFTDSGKIFFKLYTKVHNAVTGNVICAKGDIDETVSITCPAKTFVSIGYNEID